MRSDGSDSGDPRLLDGKPLPEDERFDTALRPRHLSEYIGQDKVRDNLAIFIAAARQRGEPLDHVLLYGPPGLGKTTLANIVAAEMGAQIKTTSGPVIEKAGQLAGILTSLEPGDVLFIDEVHRLNAAIEEILYPAMEDFRLDIMVGQGPSARSIPVDLKRFTLVAATTRAGLIKAPLRARFGIVHRLDFYDKESLAIILKRSARLLGVDLAADGADEIARRSRGTPRIANRLLRRVRDIAQVRGEPVVSVQVARDSLAQLEVDEHGLDDVDRRILRAIIEKFGGGPVGLRALAQAIGEDAGTIEDLHEPFLAQTGFIQRTPRGRMAAPLAYRHLGLAPRPGGQPGLW